ncbi:MAG: helix-turn-helix domain-containing protein [Planctomycetes bacterium]|nr:helix-turn-helix domain-containing protein [Planctomycetota bacterium]
MDPNPTERLLTADELARRLQCGTPKVRQLERAGAIPSVRIGASIRFEWGAVLRSLRLGSKKTHQVAA